MRATDAGAARPDQPEGIQCGNRVCTAPALCIAAAGMARCVCPLGYLDVHADGSECEDIDECQFGSGYA